MQRLLSYFQQPYLDKQDFHRNNTTVEDYMNQIKDESEKYTSEEGFENYILSYTGTYFLTLDLGLDLGVFPLLCYTYKLVASN